VVLSVANSATAIQFHPTDRFDGLFRLLYPSLVPLVERLLSDRAEAEDVVQEAFLRLARAGHNADAGRPLLEQPDEVVGAWLRRVTMNLGINRLRDRRRAEARLLRATRLDSTLDPARGPADDDGPARALLRAEARDEVQAALATLPERQRTCLLLRHAGHSYTEIAAALGIAVGSVGVYLQRGERAFRAAYRPDDSDHHPQPE
jgi:RNA polymerase sigma-70 factor (ECF subfamily)